MTGAETAQVIQATATLVTAIGVAYGIIISRGNSKKADKVIEKVDEIHVATNGMKHELMEQTAKASKGEGKEEERIEERARQTESPVKVEVTNPASNPVKVEEAKT